MSLKVLTPSNGAPPTRVSITPGRESPLAGGGALDRRRGCLLARPLLPACLLVRSHSDVQGSLPSRGWQRARVRLGSALQDRAEVVLYQAQEPLNKKPTRNQPARERKRRTAGARAASNSTKWGSANLVLPRVTDASV